MRSQRASAYVTTCLLCAEASLAPLQQDADVTLRRVASHAIQAKMGQIAAPLLERAEDGVDRIKEEFNIERQKANAKTRYEEFRKFMQQDAQKFVIFCIWMAINIFLWIEHAICTRERERERERATS